MLLGCRFFRPPGTEAVTGSTGLWARWRRHLVVAGVLVALAVALTLSRGGGLGIGVLGLGFADASMLLLCVTLSVGPAVRLMPALSPLLLWRRQLGIAVATGAALHILAFEALDPLALPRFFLREVDGQAVLQKDTVAAASWLGLTALVYLAVLTVTSNDYSQRLLGRAWKRVHGHGHTLFILSVIHTALAVYILEESKGFLFPYLLWVGVATTLGLQLLGFVATVRGEQQRGMAEAQAGPTNSGGPAGRASE